MTDKLISIIIPVYNRALLIGETLNSVLEQSYSNWECLIIDDGSTDDTNQVVNEYILIDKRFQYHYRPQNRKKGANACRNFGFELCKGDYIQWFDSDDLMHKDKLKLKAECLENHNVDFVVCEGIEYRNTIDNVIHHWNEIQSDHILLDHIIGKANFHTNGPMFKKDFLIDIPLFNEDLQRKQEWEFYSRLLTFSISYKPLAVVLYYFRLHQNSINGLDKISTLESRILSNKLVFKLAKNNLSDKDLMIVRKQFVNKYILFFKLAKQGKKINLMILCCFYGILTITLSMFFNSFFKSCRRFFK
ncbi:glycosyltransferase family 2 protein [Flavobacterium gyeonganense]|uniref:Glycosyltransferase family 2 protein n=1 Tax=Flavobacterium gyeonganense TaxID=1310418 RepID=A0ABV5H7Z8_9FLAO|nr:glycosyltransferase family 2 protein [Flavobacterium gyeonganense]